MMVVCSNVGGGRSVGRSRNERAKHGGNVKIIGVVLIVLSASLIVLEMHTITVYLLAAAAASLAGGVVALMGGGPLGTVSAMAITGVVALPLAHWARGRLKNRASEDVSRDDTGHSVTVIEAAGGVLRVAYRGSTWNARLRDSSASVPPPGQTLRIAAREGSTLVLEPPPSAV
jgi:membrane protein implicated in regulation of membrane protease activity